MNYEAYRMLNWAIKLRNYMTPTQPCTHVIIDKVPVQLSYSASLAKYVYNKTKTLSIDHASKRHPVQCSFPKEPKGVALRMRRHNIVSASISGKENCWTN